ncbi:subtilisin-like protease [Roridomyces roridus]|uniref:Subtilisin-like protease n=1 Tax=Roridomyces roridus TaxID=1738132 RepID=A0AAD7CEF7_9AGAR|nr:subtilisin-like protease [Roridomyces roridus]
MKVALPLALLATSALAAKSSLSSVQRVTNLASTSGRFIVEVKEASDIPSKREALGTPHERVYHSLRERKISFDVTKEFNSPGLFLGAAITLTNSDDVANVLNTEGVVSIRPVKTYKAPKPVSSKIVSPGDKGLPDSESTHVVTGVDKLHAMGITGKGIKIGILDTGTDYTHPFLGGGFGHGFKVAGGHDFVGDDYTGSNDPVPDSDPLDQCNGHGTHVAGIIGANPGNPFNISGVAPDAVIYSYRIFGCESTVTDDIIIDAMLTGVKDGMDILTLSLGGASGWTEETASVVASRIAASGKIVTIAAGNDGDLGSWYASGPATGLETISVASSDNTVIPLQSFTVEGVTHDPIPYYSVLPLPIDGPKKLYAISKDSTVVDDACNPLPADTPDLSEFVVLVRRGTCAFVDKLANIAAFGGNISLIYDNGGGLASIAVGDFTAVLIPADDGTFLADQLAAGASIDVTFPQVGGAVTIPAATGGLVSSFSTYGPSYDMYFKPAITAPGGNILSTYPTTMGSWALDSGTSMATPFLAGSSALLLAAKGKSVAVARSARTLFESTAQTIPSSLTDGDPLQTVAQQGAGLIQVHDAIFASTILSPAELLLNDTTHFAGTQKFTVQNVGKKIKTYTLSHVPAGTALTVDSGMVNSGPVPLTSDSATVKFNQNKFTLLPGQSHTVVATFTPPKGLDASTLPVYSGFIHATSGNESVHATYLGLAASIKDAHVVDDTDFVFGVDLPVVLDSVGDVQDVPVNYTFVGDDAPTILWRQAFGTALLRLDLVSADVAVNTTLNSRGLPWFSFSRPHNGGTFAKVPILGSLLEFDYLVRNDLGDNLDDTVLMENTFANGTVIPNGSYRVLLRSLKVTGDPKNEADYESWLSPIIGVAA